MLKMLNNIIEKSFKKKNIFSKRVDRFIYTTTLSRPTVLVLQRTAKVNKNKFGQI